MKKALALITLASIFLISCNDWEGVRKKTYISVDAKVENGQITIYDKKGKAIVSYEVVHEYSVPVDTVLVAENLKK